MHSCILFARLRNKLINSVGNYLQARAPEFGTGQVDARDMSYVLDTLDGRCLETCTVFWQER